MSGARATGPALTGLTGLVLMVTDTERARLWYEGVGFAYLRGYEGMHWVGLPGVEVMLHPADTSSGGTGLCLHAGVDDIDALFAHVVGLGHTPYDHQQAASTSDAPLTGPVTRPVTRPWGAREFELDDPDGHRWIFTANT